MMLKNFVKCKITTCIFWNYMLNYWKFTPTCPPQAGVNYLKVIHQKAGLSKIFS